MTRKTTKIDALSAAIEFSGTWGEGGNGDATLSNYDQGTFMFTCEDQASMNIVFRGDTLNVIGASRPNHSLYTVFFDGVSQGPSTKTTPSPDIPDDQIPAEFFKQSLFTWQGPLGEHRVTIRNTPSDDQVKNKDTCFDLDYIDWTGPVSSGSDLNLQDTDQGHFVYDPSWTTQVGSLPSFEQTTGHATSQQGGSVDVKFSGDRIELYGPVGKAMGAFTAQLDSASPQTYNASRAVDYREVGKQVIYTATGLESGNHTLKLTHSDQRSGHSLAIDYAIVDGDAASSAASTPASKVSRLKPGVIAGIAIGAVVFVVITALVVFLVWRRRKRRSRSKVDAPAPAMSTASPLSINPFLVPGPWQRLSSHSSYAQPSPNYDAAPQSSSVYRLEAATLPPPPSYRKGRY